jgi:MtN3 and saliva related transmembrane protein
MIWDGLGWAASAVLVVTIGHQVARQWRTGNSDGVSRWLYVGQLVAAIGFLAYAIHRVDPVFIATNTILLVAAALGLVLVVRQRSPPSPSSPSSDHGTARGGLATGPRDR